MAIQLQPSAEPGGRPRGNGQCGVQGWQEQGALGREWPDFPGERLYLEGAPQLGGQEEREPARGLSKLIGRQRPLGLIPSAPRIHVQHCAFIASSPGGSRSKDCLRSRRCRKFAPWVEKIPLGKEMATHSSVPAWRIPGTEESGGLQPVGSHRVGRD